MTEPLDMESALTSFVQDELLGDRPELSLTPDDDLLGSGLVDSLGVMRIVQFLDLEHGVRVQPADITLENFLTVRRIAAYAKTLPSNGTTHAAGPR